MYESSGEQSGTWLTVKKHENYKPVRGSREHGLYPVPNKYVDVHWPEIEHEIKKLQKDAVISSRKTGKGISRKYRKAKDFIRKYATYAGIALGTLGPAAYLYLDADKFNDGIAGLLTLVGGTAFGMYYKHRASRKRKKKHEQEHKQQIELLGGINDSLKELVRTNVGRESLQKKINDKGILENLLTEMRRGRKVKPEQIDKIRKDVMPKKIMAEMEPSVETAAVQVPGLSDYAGI